MAATMERISRDMQTFSSQKTRDPDRPWGFLPPFADEENRRLHASILELEETITQLDSEVEENNGAAKTLAEHLKRIQQDIQYTNTKLTAKRKEAETEEHLTKLAERETVQKSKTAQSRLAQQHHQLELSIFKSTEQLEAFKLEMNFNAEELQKWVLEREKQEEDKRVLEKYKRQDEALVKDLTLHIQKLNKEILNAKNELHHEVTETQAAQIELDKTADDFRQAHQERLKLVERWDETVETLKKRDQALEEASAKLIAKQTLVEEKLTDLKQLTADLESEEQRHKQLDATLESMNRELGALREAFRNEETKTRETQDSLDLAEYTHNKAQKDLTQRRDDNQTCEAQLQTLKASVQAVLEKFQSTKTQMEEEKSRLEQIELHDDALRRRLETAEEQSVEAEKEVHALKQKQYHEGQTLFEEKRQEADFISSISGIASQDRNMRCKISSLDEQILKKEEILYNINFRVVMMERKIERASGVRSDSETRELNATIESLTQELERVNSEHSMLMAQLKRAEHHLTQAQRERTYQLQHQGQLEANFDGMQLETDMLQRSLIQGQDEKENLMVEQDVMQLEISRLQQILSHKASEVSSLEAKKQLMQSSIQAKKREIQTHHDGLKYELKNLRDDIHRVKLDLSERKQRSEKLGMKYETLTSKTVSVYNDEPKSQSYFLIRAAQEREELKREGEKLSREIKQAETEVRNRRQVDGVLSGRQVAGLENALAGLLDCNKAYKESVGRDASSSLWKQHEELKEEMEHVYDRLKFRRSEESAALEEVSGVERTRTELEQRTTEHALTIDATTHELAEADRQLSRQIEKQTRAKFRAVHVRGELHNRDDKQAALVRLSAVQEVNRAILLDVKSASVDTEDPAVTQIVHELQSAGISLPNSNSNRSTPRTTRPNSTQSYRSRPATSSSLQSVSVKNMQLNL